MNEYIKFHIGSWNQITKTYVIKENKEDSIKELTNEIKINLNKEKFKEFLNSLTKCDILNWEDVYDVDICDGIQWELKMKIGEIKKNVYGSNAYPKKWNEFKKIMKSVGVKF